MIISYSDTILIRFQTDESTSLKGFAVSFMAVEPPDDDNADDFMMSTPFPGYMKSIYYSLDSFREEAETDDYHKDSNGYSSTDETAAH